MSARTPAQIRYYKSPKGRANIRRYNHGAAARATAKRYYHKPEVRAYRTLRRNSQRRAIRIQEQAI